MKTPKEIYDMIDKVDIEIEGLAEKKEKETGLMKVLDIQEEINLKRKLVQTLLWVIT